MKLVITWDSMSPNSGGEGFEPNRRQRTGVIGDLTEQQTDKRIEGMLEGVPRNKKQSRSLITGTRKLWGVVHKCRECRVVGIDTEANSFWAYQERVCLIQVIAGKNVYLVDPIALDDLAPFGQVFHDPGIIKIFHGADYDLRSLRRDFHFRIAPIFDTMIAASLLNYPAVGLAALVEKHFDVHLPKTNALTRSDWARRPVPEQHIDYLINDVVYLQPLREILIEQLEKMEILEEAEWEFRQLEQIGHRHRAPRLDMFSIKGVRRLSEIQLCVFRRLYEYREEAAEEQDCPTFKVLSNNTLKALASDMPESFRQMKKIHGITSTVVWRHGKHILQAIKDGKDDFRRKDIPQPPQKKSVRGPHSDTELLQALKEWRKEEASRRNINPQAVLPTSVAKDIASSSHLDELALYQMNGMIPSRMERYSKTLLDIYSKAKAAGKNANSSE